MYSHLFIVKYLFYDDYRVKCKKHMNSSIPLGIDDRGYQDYRDRHDQNRNNFDHQRSFNNVCCDFCGEDGHVSSVCRHLKPISCYKCGIQGHKEKKCESRPY